MDNVREFFKKIKSRIVVTFATIGLIFTIVMFIHVVLNRDFVIPIQDWNKVTGTVTRGIGGFFNGVGKTFGSVKIEKSTPTVTITPSVTVTKIPTKGGT